MKIVISGAGDVGKYLAKMLLKENHDLVMIDENEELINYIDNNYDLLTVKGSCTSFVILREANVHNCDLYIAVTRSQETNLLSCIFAKKIGAKKTIARIDNMEYQSPIHKLNFINLGIDKVIYPEIIGAREIVGVLKQTGTTEIFDFSGGKLTLFVIKIDEQSPLLNMSLREVLATKSGKNNKILAITRNNSSIIPTGDDVFRLNDLIYIITTPDGVDDLLKDVGKSDTSFRTAIFLGGSRIGVKAAKFLEAHLDIKLLEINPDKAFRLTNELSKTMIINGDGRNIDFLVEEGLENTDAFVAVTDDSETNILTCIIAKQYGVKKTIAEIENLDYINIASKMGIDTIINKKLSAASNIYTQTMNAEIANIKCLTGTKAEVLEFIVSKDAIATKSRLKDINFPAGIIVGGIVRGNKGFIAEPDTQIRPNDKVVLFALPDVIHKIARYFNA